jgi:hypothetical protein
MDVAFDVFKIREYRSGKLTLKGRWLNLGYTGSPWYCSSEESFEINKDQFENWIDITDRVSNVRTKSGVP